MGANHHFEYTKLLFGKLLSIYLLQLEPHKDRIPNTWVYDTRVILDKDWKKQWAPFTDIDRLSQVKARISNNLHRFLWDVIFFSNIFIQDKTFSHWLFSHVALCTHIISTHIKYTHKNVITHTCPNFNAGLNNPPMKLRHGSIIGKTPVRIILWCPTTKMLIKACFLIQPLEQEGGCQSCCISLCSKVFINHFYQMKESPEYLNILIYWSKYWVDILRRTIRRKV